MSIRSQSKPASAMISAAIGLQSDSHAPEVFSPALRRRFTALSMRVFISGSLPVSA